MNESPPHQQQQPTTYRAWEVQKFGLANNKTSRDPKNSNPLPNNEKTIKLVEKPILTKEDIPANHCLIKVKNASINPIDWKVANGHLALLPFMPKPPYVPGFDFSGVVEESESGVFEKGI